MTGIVPMFGHYESTLERDMMEIIRFDPNVQSFLPQPLTIEYRNNDGQKRSYTPDGLIHYKETPGYLAPTLFEVKYRKDFREQWKVFLPKFRAAKAYCIDRGWCFEVFTEREIRTPYLQNIKFLWPFRDRVSSLESSKLILIALSGLKVADPNVLLGTLCHDANDRAQMIPTLWHLISIGEIGCNLNEPLTMSSRIWTERWE
ncbi:hypothetical protein PFLmoz3_01363 [Pseudomonas fluorescens]|uniref:TnsA endonuclease N-terminal domain-containing protein n=1 Tax=Pseudomonas fluorescens TaxID=294 RepID=A0A120G892_PSEFL|nr:hypothetical protein PFLmoz3_01363 [Pseudomonas fluorescens]